MSRSSTPTIQNLSRLVTSQMRNQADAIQRRVVAEMEDYGQELVATLKQNSPERTGEYKRGWTLSEVYIPGGVEYVVHNAAKPGLTSKLEFGHYLPNKMSVEDARYGARYWVRGDGHIRRSFDQTAPAFYNRVKKITGGK